MYKAAARFQDYITRSNGYVDRILRGGNLYDTNAAAAETNIDLLAESCEILMQAKTSVEDRLRTLREQRADVRRESKGRSMRQLPAELAGRLTRIERHYDEVVSQHRFFTTHLQLVMGRLRALGYSHFDECSLHISRPVFEALAKEILALARENPDLSRCVQDFGHIIDLGGPVKLLRSDAKGYTVIK